jgi:IS30 family transposase
VLLPEGRHAHARAADGTHAASLRSGWLIHARPAVVERCTRLADWEGDDTCGLASRSAIGPLVDRRMGYLRLGHLPPGHSAERLRVAMVPVLTGPPALARRP